LAKRGALVPSLVAPLIGFIAITDQSWYYEK